MYCNIMAVTPGIKRVAHSNLNGWKKLVSPGFLFNKSDWFGMFKQFRVLPREAFETPGLDFFPSEDEDDDAASPVQIANVDS